MSAILRLVHPVYFDAVQPLPVMISAFRPTEEDKDGLSVFLADAATPEQALQAVAPKKRGLYHVVSIPWRT